MMKPWKQHSGFIPLGMFGDRGETRIMLTYHEEASKERKSERANESYSNRR